MKGYTEELDATDIEFAHMGHEPDELFNASLEKLCRTEGEKEFLRRMACEDDPKGRSSGAIAKRLEELCEGCDIDKKRQYELLTARRDALAKSVKGYKTLMVYLDRLRDFSLDLRIRGNTTAEDRVKKASELLPDLCPIVYPRRYKRPEGYCSPSALLIPAANAVAAATGVKDEFHHLFSETLRKQLHPRCEPHLFLVGKLTELRVPTYFVGQKMAEAIAQTDLPGDFSLTELQWPMDALMFQIPREVVKCPGSSIVSIAVGKITAGAHWIRGFTYEGRYRDMLTIPKYAIGLDECHILAVAETGQSYFWKCPLGEASVLQSSQTDGASIFADTTPDEMEFIKNDLPVLGLQLILCMIACPERVERGQILMSPKRRRGVVLQTALWHPNFFGRTYSPKRHERKDDDEKEPGWTVRMHWRRGHYRRQRYGEHNALSKVIWIEPVLVNAT